MKRDLLFAATLAFFSLPTFAQFSFSPTDMSCIPNTEQSTRKVDNQQIQTYAPTLKPLATDESTVITDPSGKLVKFMRSASTWKMGQVDPYANDGLVGDVVFGDDGTSVYFYNPISIYITETYIKGTMDENGIITVHLPQLVYEGFNSQTQQTYQYWVHRMVFDYNSWSASIDDETDFQFEYKDGTIKQISQSEDSSKDIFLGMTDEQGGWFNLGDTDIMYYQLPETMSDPTPPASLVTETYSIKYTDNQTMEYGSTVTAGIDGSDIYITGLPNTTSGQLWIKGHISGNKVTIPCGSYMGNNGAYYLFLMNGYIQTPTTSPLPTMTNDDFEFDYNAEEKSLTPASDNCTFVINAGYKNLYYNAWYGMPEMRPWTEKSVTPSDPIITTVVTPDDPYGYYYGYVWFDASAFDANGYYMDINQMYYNVYFDDKLFTFTPDTYMKLSEDLTNVPYTFSDGFSINYFGARHYFFYYDDTVKKIGVQIVYTGGGETKKSNITTYKIDSGSVAEQVADKEVASTVYTDLYGRRVENPENGLFIKTETYTDGTSATSKVVLTK